MSYSHLIWNMPSLDISSLKFICEEGEDTCFLFCASYFHQQRPDTLSPWQMH